MLIASPGGGSGARPASIPESYFSKINLKQAFKCAAELDVQSTFSFQECKRTLEGPGRGQQAQVPGMLFFKGLSWAQLVPPSRADLGKQTQGSGQTTE